MRDILRFGLIPFALGLGGAVAYRLSAEAMAVVAGVISAVVACTVMGGVVLVIIRGTDRRAPAGPAGQAGYPPVVIVQPGAPAQFANGQPAGWPVPNAWPAQRSFAVVGEEDLGHTQESLQLPW